MKTKTTKTDSVITPHTLLRSDLTKGGQSVLLTQLFQMGAHKLRVRIKSDSYREQCYCVIERWDSAEWREVYRVDAHGMKTPDKLVYDSGDIMPKFFDDVAQLIHAARLVLLG